MCRTWARKLGETAVNRPSTANPANPAMAARTNTPRTSGGTDTRCRRQDTGPSEVSIGSATASRNAPITRTSAMCTR